MKLDRALQRQILEAFAAIYPAAKRLPSDFAEAPIDLIEANLWYLIEHGLIANKQHETSYGVRQIGFAITYKGLDFLADDGGLSAILGVVTVRLHDDTIKALVAAKIHEADLPEPEKKRYLDQLRELPAETTKHLVLKLVDLGLEQGPKAIETIGKWLT